MGKTDVPLDECEYRQLQGYPATLVLYLGQEGAINPEPPHLVACISF